MGTRRTMMIALFAIGSLAMAAEPGSGPDALAGLPRHIALDARQHVSGQPTLEQIARLPAAGITTVINLRPAAENPGVDERAAVEQAGMKYLALPLSGAADLTPDNVRRFDQLLAGSASEKVLMHCASGNRVGAMMALRARWVQGRSAEEAMAIGRAAGLTGLAGDVQQLLEAEAPRASP